MNVFVRRMAVLFALVAMSGSAVALAQDPGEVPAGAAASGAAGRDALASQRGRVSYMVGYDIARSIAPVAPDIDLDAFRRAIENAFAGNPPLLDEAQTQATGKALMTRVRSRVGQLPAGTTVPEVDSAQVGLLVGADVGRSLAPIKGELDVSVLVAAVRDTFAQGELRMTTEEMAGVREAFTQKLQAKAAAAATTNRVEGEKFLAAHADVDGVFTTPSGLQYMVLRQGAGPKPTPGDRVRVNYEGSLLDGTVFDSSYERGEPAVFQLDQVIAGWTEGVSLMPVGAKYRFWVPGDLAYGAKGAPGGVIGPNQTLVFDVELQAILP